MEAFETWTWRKVEGNTFGYKCYDNEEVVLKRTWRENRTLNIIKKLFRTLFTHKGTEVEEEYKVWIMNNMKKDISYSKTKKQKWKAVENQWTRLNLFRSTYHCLEIINDDSSFKCWCSPYWLKFSTVFLSFTRQIPYDKWGKAQTIASCFLCSQNGVYRGTFQHNKIYSNNIPF